MGTAVTHTVPVAVLQVTQDGHLRIRDVHMVDAGLYVCRATNGFGSISINYTVIVLGELVPWA